jgi:hypothetical protein
MLGLWWARLLNNIAAIFSGAGGGGGSFESIATTTLSTTTSTINFTGIANTYQHLQVRFIARDASTNTADASILFRLGNGTADTGSNYAYHYLEGTGAVASATGAATQTSIILPAAITEGGVTASVFGVGIIDIHDYASTSKYKTVRSFQGNDRNGSGRIILSSGLWQSTSAVDYVRITKSGTGFAAGSTFALYGIKGA